MKFRPFAPVLVLAASALALSGCTFSANLTVTADSVADLAADALETSVGSRPDMDCGEEDVDLVDGTLVDCVLTDPANGEEYDATVTISDVEGTKYKVNVQVADQPRAGAGEPAETEEPEEPAEQDPAAEDIRHTVSAESVEKLAADALFRESPPYFEIDCGDGDLEVALNAVFECSATHPEGDVYDALITVTEISETNYSINVVRAANPRG